jgi:hypothetical protein
MRARTVMMGGLVALALSGCAGQGNAATTPTHGDGGNFMQFYQQQLQQPPATNVCHPTTLGQLLLPCDEGVTP